MKNLFSFLLRYSPRLVVLAIITSVATGLLNTVLLAIIHQAIANLGNIPQMLIAGFLLMAVLFPVARIISQILLVNLSQKAIFDLRIYLSRQILAAPLRELEKHGSNKLLAALTFDIMTIANAFTQVPFLFMNFTLLVSCIGYLIWLYWPAGIGVILMSLIGVSIYLLVNGRAQKHYHRAREEADDLYKHFRALTEGTKELKTHKQRRDAFISELLHFTASSYQRHIVVGSAYYAGAGSLAKLLFFGVIGVCVFLMPLYTAMDAATVSGYTIVLLYLILPLDGLTNIMPTLSSARVALQKVEDLGVTLHDMVTEEENDHPRRTTWDRLAYEAITHTFHREKEDRAFTLGPISLALTPGELVFLVGGNGSGKTTLAKLMTGLYAPESGRIVMDGEAITDQNRDQFRQYFSIIFTDFFLFDSFLGLDPKMIDEKAEQYLKDLQLDHKVSIDDGKLSTLDLSQGQRKRLGLLTAYLEDRPIYLFDEWAADQDPLFKEFFYLSLLPELRARGKTIIVISHDDHYYHVADRIIRLDYGQLEYDKTLVSPGGEHPLEGQPNAAPSAARAR